MEEATCPVCLEVFSNPQILVCSHNVCHTCALKLSNKEEENNNCNNNNNSEADNFKSSDQKEVKNSNHEIKDKNNENLQDNNKNNDIICPVCRCTTPIGQLKSNIALKNVVEILKKKTTEGNFKI